MSFSAPFGDTPRPRPAPDGGTSSRRRISPLAITLGALGLLVVLLVLASEIWTKYLWFQQLQVTEVLAVRWGTQAILFVLGLLLFTAPLFPSLRLAYLRRPV